MSFILKQIYRQNEDFLCKQTFIFYRKLITTKWWISDIMCPIPSPIFTLQPNDLETKTSPSNCDNYKSSLSCKPLGEPVVTFLAWIIMFVRPLMIHLSEKSKARGTLVRDNMMPSGRDGQFSNWWGMTHPGESNEHFQITINSILTLRISNFRTGRIFFIHNGFCR